MFCSLTYHQNPLITGAHTHTPNSHSSAATLSRLFHAPFPSSPLLAHRGAVQALRPPTGRLTVLPCPWIAFVLPFHCPRTAGGSGVTTRSVSSLFPFSFITPLLLGLLSSRCGAQYEAMEGLHYVGAHVRDAACYVLWAFARAYAPAVMASYMESLARALVVAALFDREARTSLTRFHTSSFPLPLGRRSVFACSLLPTTANHTALVVISRQGSPSCNAGHHSSSSHLPPRSAYSTHAPHANRTSSRPHHSCGVLSVGGARRSTAGARLRPPSRSTLGARSFITGARELGVEKGAMEEARGNRGRKGGQHRHKEKGHNIGDLHAERCGSSSGRGNGHGGSALPKFAHGSGLHIWHTLMRNGLPERREVFLRSPACLTTCFHQISIHSCLARLHRTRDPGKDSWVALQAFYTLIAAQLPHAQRQAAMSLGGFSFRMATMRLNPPRLSCRGVVHRHAVCATRAPSPTALR